MTNNVDLKKLQEGLESDNTAMKKRALAIILNESVVEAKSLLEKLEVSDPDPEIRTLARKIKAKLMAQEKSFSEANFEQILDLLEKRDPESRRKALRSLLPRQTKVIPRLVRDYFSNEIQPETVNLVVDILKRNPSVLNLEQLTGLLRNPSDELRFKAFEAIEETLYSSVYPEMFRGLIDSSQKVKLQAYQFLGKLGRNEFLETLSYMLKSPNSDLSRLAGTLLPTFLGKDMVPLLQPHLGHADQETGAFCRKALELLTQKGVTEAAAALGIAPEPPLTPSPEAGQPDVIERIKELILSFPPWLAGSLEKRDEEIVLTNPFQAMREMFFCVKEFLGFSFLCAYLEFGEKAQWLDIGCFRALQQTPKKCNTIQLLRAISNALPKPQSAQDLLPLNLSQRIFTDENDIFLEKILSFLEVFRLVDQNPGEAENLMTPALEGFEQFLDAISSIRDNHLVVKTLVNGHPRFYNFNTFPITPLDPQLLTNFDLEMHCPTLISGDFSRALNLSPFLRFDLSESMVQIQTPGEQELWSFLTRYGIMEGYMNSIVDTYVTDHHEEETYQRETF